MKPRCTNQLSDLTHEAQMYQSAVWPRTWSPDVPVSCLTSHIKPRCTSLLSNNVPHLRIGWSTIEAQKRYHILSKLMLVNTTMKNGVSKNYIHNSGVIFLHCSSLGRMNCSCFVHKHCITSTLHHQYFVLPVLCITSTLYYQYFALPVLCITSTLYYQYFALPVLCITSTLHYQYSALPVLCITSTLHYQYFALPVLCITSTLYYQYSAFTVLWRRL